jgi:RecJ-like exonuclease
MNKNQKIVCLSHREDPDGIVSAVLFKNLFDAEIFLTDYTNIVSELEEISKIDHLAELYICDLSPPSHIHSDFIKIIQNISNNDTLIWFIDHHKLPQSFENNLKETSVNITLKFDDCASAIIYNQFKNKFKKDFSFLVACASITDHMETGTIAKQLISQQERMFLFFNSSLLWFIIRNNQKDPKKLNPIINSLNKNKLPYQLLNDFSELKSSLTKLDQSYSEIRKSQNHHEKFNSIEIFNGKFSEILEKSLSTSTKNISVVYKKNKTDESVDILVLSKSKLEISIGEIINSISSKFAGAGGGDSEKAAAVIPEKNLENFLNDLDLKL